MWGGGGGGGGARSPTRRGTSPCAHAARPCSQQQIDAGKCAPGVNFERDSGLKQRHGPEPMYKPEFWERVQHLDREGIQEDPTFHCKPAGVPRMGPPAKIVQTATELIFLYQQGNTFRVIPIDGRPHDPIKSQDTTWYGDAVGKWEGDTLVIDIVGFNDESWLGLARLVPQQQHARRRAVHAHGQHAAVGGDGRGSGRRCSSRSDGCAHASG